jgi:competence protein ComEA
VGPFADRSRLVAFAVAAILLVVAAVRYLGPGGEEPPDEPVTIDEAGAGGADAPASAGERLYVHVAGEVRDPGLYRLPPGARVGAAIDRAGGIERRADLSAVNLAAELQDGQQVLVPTRASGAAPAATTPPTAETPSTGAHAAAPISLSQATPEELDAGVDGIGPVLAQRIVEFRDEQGGVGAIEELEGVDGIGEERIADLREALVP